MFLAATGGAIHVNTLDIRDDSRAEIKANYLETECKKYDMIITNPAFNIAQEIIEKALNDCKDGGWVIMLLRLNFFESLKRKEFWDKNMAKYAFVHRKRLKFSNTTSTDSTAYMHCCWHKGENPEFCKLKII